jgi:hypothetical protein
VPDEPFPLAWTVLPDATVTLLLAWFGHALINWSAGSFTYTDVFSVAHTVRLVPGSFVTKPVAAGHAVDMRLRREFF